MATKSQGTTTANAAHRRGFTLVEMLVVLAITAILLVILFVPLSRSLELVQRANAKIRGQDSVRAAMRRVSRDLAEAMEVLPPRPLEIWGFDQWAAGPDRGIPLPTATPKRYLTRGSIIALRMPKRRFFCTLFQHAVTPQDISDPNTGPLPGAPVQASDLIALDSCPRHPGSPVEWRPVSPQQPDERIVVYFVGLENPRIRYPNSGQLVQPGDPRPPLYRNLINFGRTGNAEFDATPFNTYTLFRIEFDPSDPNFGNWTLPNGSPNPSFFYDAAAAPNGLPYCENWANAAVSVVNAETGDVVRFLETGGEFIPHALCSFVPSAREEEVAQPDRSVGLYQLSGATRPNDIPPAEYVLDHGSWVGLAADGQRPLPDNLIVSNTVVMNPPPNATVELGPRIRVIEHLNGRLTTVYDSANPMLRGRLVAYDSVTGRVSMSFARQDAGASDPITRDHYAAAIVGNYEARLGLDLAVDANGMPGGLGAAQARFGRLAMVSPGSETVLLAIAGTNGLANATTLKRAGWTGLGPGIDHYVAQSELDADEYTIDYRSGMITLSSRPEAIQEWADVANNQKGLLVKYQFQANAWDDGEVFDDVNRNGVHDGGEAFTDENGNGSYDPPRPFNDVVRVSYATRETYTVTLGAVEYTRQRREVLPFEVSSRVIIGNQKR